MELSLLFTVICLSGFVISVPVNKNYVENRCTYECSNDPQNLLFEIGKTYVYSYKAKSKLDINNVIGSSQMEISANAEITALSPCEHSLQLKNVKVSNVHQDPQMERELEERVLLFSYDDGKISSVCADPEDPTWVVNVKKALLSSFQISLRDLNGKHTLQERDIMGNCKTTYETKVSSWKGILLRKTKQVSSCSNRQKSLFSLFPPKYITSKNFAIQTNPLISDDYSCNILVKNRFVNTVKCTEKSSIFPLSFSKSNVIVQSQIELVFQSYETAHEIAPITKVQRSDLFYQFNDHVERTDEEKVANILRKICENVHDVVNSQVPAQFTELIHSIRGLPHQATYRIWKSVQRGDLCSSRKLRDIFIDALAMDASEGSVRIIVEMINNKEVNSVQANYWLTLLAFSNKPSEEAIKATLPLVRNQQAPRQALLGVSSMIQNYCRRTQTCASSQVVQEIIQNIVRRIPKDCSGSEDDITVALRAIANIAPFDSSFYLLNNVFTCLSSKFVGVQVAAIESLENYACEQTASNKLFYLLQNRQLKSEIRISAYKSLMSCPNQDIVKNIMSVLEQEKSEQVGSYIVSHLKNIQETSDPFKQSMKDAFASEALPVDKFPKDFRKYSRNYELSYLFEKVNVGATVEADVIYDQSIVPRSIRTNITLPIFGSAFNVMEFGIRQEGLESALESLARSDLLKKHNISEFAQGILDLFNNNEISNEKSSYHFKSFNNLHKLKALRDQAYVLKKNSSGTLYLKIDGKYIAHLSMNDISKGLLENIWDAYIKSIKKLSDLTKTDRAFSFMLQQSIHEFPGTNGLPLRVRINAPIVMGYKQNERGIFPSFASELSVKMAYVVKSFEPSVEWISRLSSGLAFNYEYKDDKKIQITISPANNDINLFSYQSYFYVTDEKNNTQLLKTKTQNYQGCSKSLSKYFGVELCSNLTMLKPSFSFKHPLVLMNGQFEFGVSLRKTDLSMKGWQVTFEMPQKESKAIQTYHIGFNTPGSSVDREISAELQFTNPNERIRALRVILKSPLKKIDLTGAVRYDERQVSSKVELLVDQQLKYKLDAEIVPEMTPNTIKYSSKLGIEIPERRPLIINGTVTINQGSRSSLNIDLKVDNGKPLFLGGRIIKDSSKIGSTKLSMDIKADLGFIFFRLNGYSNKQKEHTASKIEISYMRPNSKRHLVKLESKLQNLSQKSLQKFVSFVEVEMTEFPQFNFHFSWNILHKFNEHLENEVTFMWKDDYRNSNRKIHLLQVSKFTGIREMRTITAQNLVTLNIPPLEVDYEFKLIGHVELRDAPNHRFKIVTIEMSSKAKKSHTLNWAHIKFQNPSVKPMKFSFDARVKIASIELRYSDKLEEVKPNQYKGSTNLSWGPSKQATIDYIFRVKSNKVKQHIEAEAEIKTLSSQRPIRFEGLYRREQKELELRSAFTNQGLNVLAFRTVFSMNSKSKMYLEIPSFSGAIGVQLVGDRSLTLHLNEKRLQILHDTNVQLKPNELIINSVTAHKKRKLFTLNTYLTKNEDSRFSVELDNLMSINLAFNRTSKQPTGLMEIQSIPYEFEHNTFVSYEPFSLNLDSKTKYKGENILDVRSFVSSKLESYLNIYTPKFIVKGNGKFQNKKGSAQISAKDTRNQWSHNTVVSYDVLSIEVDSYTLKEQEEILSVHSTFSMEKESSLKITSKRFKGVIRVQMKNEKGFWIDLVDKLTSMRHLGSVEVARNGARLSWLTEKSNSKLLILDGLLEGRNVKLSSEYKNSRVEVYFKRWNELKINYVNNKQSLAHKTLIKVQSDSATMYTLTTVEGRTMLSIDSKFSKMSYIKIKTNKYFANLEFYSDEDKRVKIEFNTNNLIHHNTNIIYTSHKKLEVNSLTMKESKNLLKFKAQLNKSLFYLECDSKYLFGSLEIKRYGQKNYGKLEIRDQLRDINHSTNVTYETMKFLVLNSKTEKRNEKLIEANLKLDAYSKSFVKVSHKKYVTSFEYEPSSNKKEYILSVETEDRSFDHKTQVTYQQGTMDINSSTKKDKFYTNIISRMSNSKSSYVKIMCDLFKSELIWSLYSKDKSLQFNLNGKNIPYYHSTIFEYKPLMLKLNSLTKDKNNREVAKVYIFLDGNITPKMANIQCDLLKLKHQSQITLDNRKLILKSVTNLSRNTVLVNGQFAMKEASYLKVTLPSSEYMAEVDIYNENKKAKLAVNLNNNQYRHETLVAYKPEEASLKSKTLKHNEIIHDINTKISIRNNSLIQIRYLNHLGTLKLHPFGNNKKIEMEMQSPKYSLAHLSEYNRLKREVNSKSSYQGKHIYDLKTSWSEQSGNLDITTSWFRGKINVDLPNRSLDFDYIQDKHLVGKLSLARKNSFLMLFQWDADRNPNQKIMLSINKQLLGNLQTEISFRLNLIRYKSESIIRYGNLLKGPNSIMLSLQIPEFERQILELYHEIKDSTMKCNIKYMEGSVVKLALDINSEIIKNYNTFKVDTLIDLKAENFDNDGLSINISNEYSNQRNLKTRVTGKLGSNKRFFISSDGEKTYDGFKSKLIAELPIQGYEKYEFEINGKFSPSNSKIISHGTVGTKKTNFEGKYSINSDKAELYAKFNSQLPLPSYEVMSIFDREKRSFLFQFLKDKIPVTHLKGMFKYESYDLFKGSLFAQYKDQHLIEGSIEGSQNQYSLDAKVEKQSKVLASLKVFMKNHLGLWSGQTKVTNNGALVVSIDFNQKKIRSGMASQVIYKTAQESYNLFYTSSKFGDSDKKTLKICEQATTQCYSLETMATFNLEDYQNLDEKFSLSYRNKVNKLYKVEYMLKFGEEYNSQLTISLNEEKYGYILQSKSIGDSRSLVLKGFFGKLVSSLRAELDPRRSKMFFVEFVPDSLKSTNKLVIEMEKQTSNNQENVYSLKLNHNSLEKPIVITLTLINTNDQRKARLDLNCLNDPSKMIIMDANMQWKDESNFTYAFNIYQKNRRNLDVGVNGHVSLRPIFTLSHNWHWLNINFKRKTGFYFLKVDLENREFYSLSKNEDQKSDITGKLESQNRRTSFVGKVKTNEFERTFNVFLDLQRQPCFEMRVVDQQGKPTYRIHSCISTESTKLLKFIVESYDHLTKSTDASITFEKDSRKLSGSVHWKPKSLGSALTFLNRVIRKRHTFQTNEVIEGLRHTKNTLGSEFENVYQPLLSSLLRDYERFSYESGLNSIKEKVLKQADKYLPSIDSIKSFLRVDFAIQKFNGYIEKIEKFCTYDSLCYKIADAYGKYDYKFFQNQIGNKIKKWLYKTNEVYSQLNKSFENVMKYVYELTEQVTLILNSLFEPLNNRIMKHIEDVVNVWKQHAQGLEYHIKIFINKILREVEHIAEKNSDLKALHKITTNILREINDELQQIDFDKIFKLISEARKTFLSPENWASQLRFFHYDLENGEIDFQIWSPIIKNHMNNIFNIENGYERIYDQLNTLKSNIVYMMTSPFKARAMIVSGKHFITFDNKFYDFAGSGCTYLLAGDFKDNNFTASVKYHGYKNGEIMKTIVLTLKDQLIEVSNQEKYVKVNNKHAEMPYHHDNISIVREGKHINVDDKHGVRLECDTDYDICTLSVAGWYFGKTKGMFGTYDYDNSNDMIIPQGKQAASVEEMANEWKVERSCKSENVASNTEVMEGTDGYTFCQNLFEGDNSSLRYAFSLVDPKNYMQMCLRKMKALKEKKEIEKAACTVAAAYVTSLKQFNLEISMPKECLLCDGIEFGSRMSLQESSQKKADVIFVVEENKCSENFTQQLEDISKYVWLGLRSDNVDTKFGLIGMGSSFEKGKVHKHTTNGDILFDAKNIGFASRKVSHYPEYHEADAFEAIAQAAEYPFRVGASKNIILITCSKCSTKSTRMDYTDIHRMLLNEGITLHVINKEPIEIKGSFKKSKDIFAVDAETVYRKGDLISVELKGQKSLRSQVKIPENVCIVLAHESNGSYFSTAQLVNNEKEWSSLVARRVAKTAKPQPCQKCDCVLDRDLIHSKTVCRPCKSSS